MNAYPYGGLRSCSSAIDLIPYQLEPALAIFRHGHPRLLIADDVGLGKTVEAGLILAELASRTDEVRALVLVPAGLRDQWHEELARHFKLDTIAADALWLRTLGRELPPDVNPWSLPGIYVSSWDFVKRPEALRALEDVAWDLLVTDEAHAATLATDRRAALHAIASRARRVVLLTATPPPDPAEFDALCRIGANASDSRIVMFQRNRTTQSGSTLRRSIVLTVRISDAERRMHRLLERYTTLVWREAARRPASQARLASVILRKRALSGAGSLELSLRRRQQLLNDRCAISELQLLLPLDDDTTTDDVVADEALGMEGLDNRGSEQRWLAALVRAAEAAAHQESKVRLLLKLLRRIGQPAIVFTEYRDTLERLRLQLEHSGHRTCVLHGGLSRAQRADALASFAHRTTTLLATDAAAEGLNLQHACRVIVHYELPWNPSRMLQRAGRVDRIGQGRRVHEIALVASDTAESLVLAPLARRAMDRLTAGGSGRMLELLSESRVAEVVFGRPLSIMSERPPVPPPCVLMTELHGEGVAEAHRLLQRRIMIREARVATVTGSEAVIPITVLQRSTLRPGIVLVFDLTAITMHGEIVERAPLAIHITLHLALWSRKPARIKQRVVEILPALLAAASSTLDEAGRRQVDSLRPRYLAAVERLSRRAEAITRHRDSVARQLVQAGLFDRRPPRSSRSFRLPPSRGALPPSPRLRRTAVALAEAGRRTAEALAEAGQPEDLPPEGGGPTSNHPIELRSSVDLRALLVVSPR